MKKSLLAIAAFMVLGITEAQDLPKGPKAKNAKVWNSNKKSLPVMYQSNPETVSGADAKQFKTWNSESSKLRIQTRREINNPKGLEAKNRKVWEEGTLRVNSNASYVVPKTLKKRKFWWH